MLAHVFAIDVAAYAVMSNHYHVVLRIDSTRAQAWSDEQVLQRWTQLFTGPLLVRRYLSLARSQMGQAELEKVREMAGTLRARLQDLSWFMRVLNESLAHQANAEDGCTGRFWEGRFKSQALLDERAVLAAMAYVDLNPVRASIAATPEASDYTSIQERLRGAAPPALELVAPQPEPALAPVPQPVSEEEAAAATQAPERAAVCQPPARLPQAPLMPFDATARTPWAVPFGWHDYADLVNWSGRQVHPHKKGCIAAQAPALLERLGLEAEAFIAMAATFLQEFGCAVGAPEQLTRLCARRQTRFLRGMRAVRRVFGR